MVTKKGYLISFTFSETFKDEPIPHKNFMFPGQESYEITGVAIGILCGSKTLGIRRVKEVVPFSLVYLMDPSLTPVASVVFVMEPSSVHSMFLEEITNDLLSYKCLKLKIAFKSLD